MGFVWNGGLPVMRANLVIENFLTSVYFFDKLVGENNFEYTAEILFFLIKSKMRMIKMRIVFDRNTGIIF